MGELAFSFEILMGGEDRTAAIDPWGDSIGGLCGSSFLAQVEVIYWLQNFSWALL